MDALRRHFLQALGDFVVDGGGQAHVETTAYEGQAKLLARQAPLESFLWSSYGQYLKGPKERPPWLRVDRLLGLRLQPAEDNKLALE